MTEPLTGYSSATLLTGFDMGDYGVKASKPGNDVKTAVIAATQFSTKYSTLKIYLQGDTSFTTDGSGAGSVEITHGLGFAPAFYVFRKGTASFSFLDASSLRARVEGWDREEKLKQQEEKSQFIKDSAQDALNTISEIEKGIGHFGLYGQLPSIPGTPRYTWETNINKLLSGKMIDLMTQMKEASKTGATGFGRLSEKEGQILREASTALKRGLPPEKAQEYLNSMKSALQKVISKTNIQSQQQNIPQIGQTFNNEQVINVQRVE